MDEADVEVVLSRLPHEIKARIVGVHFVDRARGNRRLGYTTVRGRREIALCALPRHVSLNPFIGARETALMFGAVKGAQWPPLAVRRFMLYDVLLHEIGHLQVIDENARSARRKFADETLAQELANTWREDLWSKRFDHADPVHNAPSAEETAALSQWAEAHAAYKQGVGLPREDAHRHFASAVSLFPTHSLALEELAQCIVGKALAKGEDDVDEARTQAVELLRRALISDPTSVRANLQRGWNCGHLGRYEDARRHLARAVRLGPLSAAQLSALGDAHADWGFLAEAERLFRQAFALVPGRPQTLLYHARAIWDLAPHTPDETSRALALFERALAARPDEARCHLHLARALATIPGESARALGHAERALELSPEDASTSELVMRLREPLHAGELAHLEREVLSTRRFDRRTGEVIENE